MERLPEFLSEADVQKLIAGACTDKNRLIVQTMFVLGLRVSELTGILLNRIDHQRRLVIIYGKGNRQRILPVPDYLYDQWAQHVQKEKPKDFLFENCYAEQYNVRRVREIVYESARRAGIEHTWPHKLRHSRATQLLNSELPLPSLQRFLGHAHLNTTAIYTHLAVEPMRKFL